MGVYVVRAFVQLCDLLASNKTLAQKLSEPEHKLKNHHKAIATILSAIRELQRSPVPKRRPMGTAHPLGHPRRRSPVPRSVPVFM
jgi:hypothetical protein